jgi:hypothetical protein
MTVRPERDPLGDIVGDKVERADGGDEDWKEEQLRKRQAEGRSTVGHFTGRDDDVADRDAARAGRRWFVTRGDDDVAIALDGVHPRSHVDRPSPRRQ